MTRQTRPLQLKIEYLKSSALIPNPENAREHSREQIARLQASIKTFGFTNPALIDENNMIIAGHGRVEAARHAGLDAIPCIRLKGLSKAEKVALWSAP